MRACIFLLLCSCTVVTEVGVTGLGAEKLLVHTRNLHTLNAKHLSVKAQVTTRETSLTALDHAFGPVFLDAEDGWMLGLEYSARLRLKLHPRAHPYLITTHSAGYTEGWQGSDVRYTFGTGLGAGVQFNLRPELSLTVDYRWLHISNGKSVQGDRFRQVFGLKKAEENHGYQSGGVFIGVVYTF